ncbi:MAG: hypothetical protein QNJ44_16425 [Rhodobacter sp.]|nr:hypothetical protein [Rhodobacter sp.]
MSPHLIPAGAPLTLDPQRTGQERLWDCYDAYVDRVGDRIIHDIVHSEPLLGLMAAVEAGQITRGQFLLHTALLAEGQIGNGGLDQLISNFPQLVEDFAILLETLEQDAFLNAYCRVADPMIASLQKARKGPRLVPAKARYLRHCIRVEATLTETPQELFDLVDDHFTLIYEDKSDPSRWGVLPKESWATGLCEAVAAYVEAKPGEFIAA